MKIVPVAVRVLVVAFQESSPLVPASSWLTAWLITWLAAVVLLTPRVTVHVVVPWPPVMVMSSSSILTRQVPLAGKPLAEATVIVVWEAVLADASVVEAPLPPRRVYAVTGV